MPVPQYPSGADSFERTLRWPLVPPQDIFLGGF